MKHGLLLIALFIAATALTSGEHSSAYMALITTHSPNTTTTHSPNTTTTHSPNTTTTHSPNTTTTHSPNTTTTHSPNTTTHNPNSTTTAPSTTTTSIPVPTPSTNMTTGNYNFSDAKGTLCIMVVAAIGIHVNTSEVNGIFIVQPSKTNVSGDCSEEVASLMITFNEGEISLQFQKNKTTKKVYVKYVQYELTYAFKRGALRNYTGTNRSLELFSVDLGYSYSCKAEKVYMGGGVSLDLTQYRFQAFDIKNKNFGPPELCKADQPDYRVPIAVGIILIILIIIVVIAYLISRKRRTDGYQSL
ncbi:macrosialin-like isoform X2 [Sinocyclocheilus rhinocerous]|uniref:macrosialin-like isoform X2 n=1 Tax=Sinocyclocheilus rhinocerous TaxID=307959 RepID=UPI0007BACC08|nr:PREDICTED: macrosialin-like isoform X2 [Sinocyclocheilus rhinocerous]